MAIFSAIMAWAGSQLAFMGGGALSIAGLSPAVTTAILAVGRGALWSLAGQALNRPEMPRQQVMATLSQTDAPRVRAYGRNLLGGQRALFEARDDHLHQVVATCHGEVQGLIRIWVDGEPVGTDPTPSPADGGGRINRYTAVFFKNGGGRGGNYSGVFSGDGLGWSDVHQAFPTIWTANHRLEGQATFYAVFGDPSDEDFVEYFPKGPNTVVQAEFRGLKIRDFDGSLVYTENAGFIIRDLLTNPDGWNIPLSSLDTGVWQTFAAICRQSVPLAVGGVEDRYRICGYYTLNDALKDVTARMLSTCDGQIYETADGKIGILGGQWSEPDVTITADDIIKLSVKPGFDPFTDYNVLKSTFVSPDHGYQPTSVADWRDEGAIAEHGERAEMFDVDMCPSGSQMQRLMEIRAAKDRRKWIGTMRTNLVGMKARYPKGNGIHTIRIEAGIPEFDGVYEVTSHVFSVPDGFCEIGIASIDNVYAEWNVGKERPIPPSVSDLDTPVHYQEPPQNRSVTQEVVDLSAGVTGVRALVTVDPPPRDGLRLQAQIARGNYAANNNSAPWVEMAGTQSRAQSGILGNLGQYTVRVKWRSRSDWILAGTVTVIATPVEPDPPTLFNATATGDDVYLDWVNAETQFYRTNIYRGTSTSFVNASLIRSVAGSAGQPSSTTDNGLSPGTYRYWAVTINPSQVASDPTGPKTVTIT